MRKQFISTSNVARFHGALEGLSKRGAAEASLLVVDGEPGLGKTTTLEHWAVMNEATFLRAKKQWTASWFMQDLLAELRVTSPKPSFARRFETSLGALADRAQQAAIGGRPYALIIDEADHVSRSRDIMETIRDLTDIGGVTCVLVGMGKIRDNLSAYPQIARRVSRYVRFEPASIADVRALADGLCEVPIADDLLEFVFRASRGMNAEIMEALANIERVGKRNRATADRPVDLATMARLEVMNDRRTGRAILVPEAA